MTQARKDIDTWAEDAFQRWMDDCHWRYQSIGVSKREAFAYMGMVCMLGLLSMAVAYQADEEMFIEVIRRSFRKVKAEHDHILQELRGVE